MQNNLITFINPPNSPFSSQGILIEPIDTLGLASHIKHAGYETSMLDMDVKKMMSSDLITFFENGWPAIITIVFDYHIPLHDAGANKEIKNICDLAHTHGSTIILGGKAATFYTEQQLEQLGSDIYIKHDMETPLLEILSLLKSNPSSWKEKLSSIENIRYIENKQLYETSTNYIKQNLNELAIPDRTLLDIDDYIDVRTILSSRGCNLKCTFCHVPGFWGNWNGRSVSSVVSEITGLVAQLDSKKILFLDDNAMAQPKRLADIATSLKENNVKVAMGCLGTVASYNREMLQKMYDGGFRWIHYGAESADDLQLKTMGKKITSDKIMHAVNGTREIGFRVRTSWILDMPDLSEEGLLKTEQMILEHGADEIRLHFLTIRLGSILHELYHLDTPQFIHNSKPNLNISGVSDQLLHESVLRILKGLTQQGYTIVRNPDDFIDIEKLTSINPKLKIVSLCPLRYGLGWKI